MPKNKSLRSKDDAIVEYVKDNQGLAVGEIREYKCKYYGYMYYYIDYYNDDVAPFNYNDPKQLVDTILRYYADEGNILNVIAERFKREVPGGHKLLSEISIITAPSNRTD